MCYFLLVDRCKLCPGYNLYLRRYWLKFVFICKLSLMIFLLNKYYVQTLDSQYNCINIGILVWLKNKYIGFAVCCL